MTLFVGNYFVAVDHAGRTRGDVVRATLQRLLAA
jgi:hypothetical protein